MASSEIRNGQIRAAGTLAGEALKGLVTVSADVQRTLTRQADRYLPAGPARQINAAQSAISGAVHGLAGMITRHLPSVMAELTVVVGRGSVPSPFEGRLGQVALSAMHAFGGEAVSRHEALRIGMAVRADGQDLVLDAETVGAAFPGATAHIVVFVHGMAEDELYWQIPEAGPDRANAHRRSYGMRLAEKLPITAVTLRYDTGRRISDNGEGLDDLLTRLVQAWPVPVESVILVGHSMGGLVSHSACIQAAAAQREWVEKLRLVVTLGSPHLGADLERLAHMGQVALALLPVSAPTARIINALRSPGVHDLRHGAVTREEWDQEGDIFQDRCLPVPRPGAAQYCYVSASLTRNPRNPLGRLLGDGLVREYSALGQGRLRQLPLHGSAHVAGTDHISLLNHPEVYTQLREWISRAVTAAEKAPAG